MKVLKNSAALVLFRGASLALAACGSSGPGQDPNPVPQGGVTSANGGASTQGGSSAQGGASTQGGAPQSGGRPAASNGGTTSRGGAPTAGAATAVQGGAAANAQGGSTAMTGNCRVGTWPAADPAAMGPYATVTENNVGPEAGEAEDGVVPKFTLFRPKDLSPNGLCHPVITWGNGTGSTPSLYASLLNLFASHGFIVIGSNSKNVARGTPRPMLVGIDWVLQQNDDPSSPLYHRIDTTHIGATGHSQGAMATSQASGDSRITTNVPIQGAMAQRNLHGPAMFFCGGMDEIVPCAGSQTALNAVTTLPAMYAEYLSVDHGSWLSRGNRPNAVYAAVTAWMRLHLMGDTALRPWFYGADCKLCTDTGWNIQQKNMDQ